MVSPPQNCSEEETPPAETVIVKTWVPSDNWLGLITSVSDVDIVGFRVQINDGSAVQGFDAIMAWTITVLPTLATSGDKMSNTIEISFVSVKSIVKSPLYSTPKTFITELKGNITR